jgi:hypothetical protein
MDGVLMQSAFEINDRNSNNEIHWVTAFIVTKKEARGERERKSEREKEMAR